MPELADILRAHWPQYLERHPGRVLPSHRKAVQRILDCRTAALGGRVYACPDHGAAYAYHSCNHRACPKCGNDKASAWLEKQKGRLLPIPHFMAVFTLPAELRPLARSNQKDVYSLMFRCGWQALARRYRTLVRREFKKLGLIGQADPKAWSKEWAVNVARPQSDQSIEGGLKYLAPYVFRTAISNKRILTLEDGKVTFLHTPSGTRKPIPMKLDALEFIGRFLQHVLPRGFIKVRYFGYYHHKRKALIERARQELGAVPVYRFEAKKPKPCFLCPRCRKEMELVGRILPIRAPPNSISS